MDGERQQVVYDESLRPAPWSSRLVSQVADPKVQPQASLPLSPVASPGAPATPETPTVLELCSRAEEAGSCAAEGPLCGISWAPKENPSGSFTQTHTSPCTFPQNRPLVTVGLGLSTSPHTRWYLSLMTVTLGLSPAPFLPRGPVPLRASLPCPEAWTCLGHCGTPDLLTSPLPHTSKPRSCHLECG